MTDRSRKRRFERSTDQSFWEIKLSALTQTVWNGNGTVVNPATVKTYASKTAAERGYDKLVDKWLANHFEEVAPSRASRSRPKGPQPRKSPPRNWSHEVLGPLHAVKGMDSLWEREISLKIFGEQRSLMLQVQGALGDDFSSQQLESFRRFMRKKVGLIKAAERALYKYYQDICSELRDQFGNSADELAPVAKSIGDFENIVKFQTLLVPEGRKTRTIVVLVECTWDSSHGVGVLLVNEEVAAVGSQDLVLLS